MATVRCSILFSCMMIISLHNIFACHVLVQGPEQCNMSHYWEDQWFIVVQLSNPDQVSRYMTEHDIDVAMINRNREHGLMFAVLAGNREVAERLLAIASLRKPSMVNYEDNDGNTALSIAMHRKDSEMERLLRQYGAQEQNQAEDEIRSRLIRASSRLKDLSDCWLLCSA